MGVAAFVGKMPHASHIFNKTLWTEVMTRTWLLPQTDREGGGEICGSPWFKRFFLFC